MNFLLITLYAFLGIIVLILASVVIQEGSLIISNLADYIMDLFQSADLHPNHSGFSALVQLLLIAAFIGWAISRFKK